MGRKPSYKYDPSRNEGAKAKARSYGRVAYLGIYYSVALLLWLGALFIVTWFIIAIAAIVTAGFSNMIYEATNVEQFRLIAGAAYRVVVGATDIFIALLDLLASAI